MFKITLLFESNEPGIYTKEEETATHEEWLKMKKTRMINRWIKNLCPDVDHEIIDTKDYEYKLNFIKTYIETLNENDNGQRKFNIMDEEI